MSFIKKFSKDTLVYGLGRGLKKFIGIFLLPFYARALTPADYGVLETLGTFVFFVIAFLNLGLDSASSFYYFRPDNQNERGKILFTVFVIRLLCVAPVLILGFFAREVSILLFHTAGYSNVVLVSSILIPLNVLSSDQQLVYRFNREPWKYNIFVIAKSLLNIAGGILLVVKLSYGVYGAQLASLLSTLAVVVFSFLFFTRSKYNYHFSLHWAKKLLHYGFPLVFAGIAVWLYQSSDRFFLLHYQSLKSIGYYSIGATFSQPLGLLNMAIQMSFGVLFYEIYNREAAGGKPESKRAVVTLVKLYTVVAIMGSMFLSIFAEEIVGFIATAKFLPGITVIPILLFSSILAQLVEIIGIGITISERTILFTYITLASGLVNVALNFIFVPLLSFYGASLTTLIAYVVNLGMTYTLAQRYFKLELPMGRLALLFTACLVVASIIPFAEIQFGLSIPLYIKLLLFLSIALLPFLLRVHDFKKTLSLAMSRIS